MHPFPEGSSGGSLGGTGGSSTDQPISAQPRGSLYYPQDFGSCGGAGHTGSVGYGGGIITLSSPVIDLNGKLAADGADSTEDRNGGGSGGSILIQSKTICFLVAWFQYEKAT